MERLCASKTHITTELESFEIKSSPVLDLRLRKRRVQDAAAEVKQPLAGQVSGAQEVGVDVNSLSSFLGVISAVVHEDSIEKCVQNNELVFKCVKFRHQSIRTHLFSLKVFL